MTMDVRIREATPDDAEACSRICYEAFKAISGAHGFPPDFSSIEEAMGMIAYMAGAPGHYGVVAEVNERVAGSNFIDERGSIGGIGPITVDPELQNGSIGRQLMQAVLKRAEEKGSAGIRLVQTAFHNRSLALYTKLGFMAREPLSCIQGPPLGLKLPGYTVRQATRDDVRACNRLCWNIHGHDRGAELTEAVDGGMASVVLQGDRVTGYATMIGFGGHALGESNNDLKALIGAAPAISGPGFLLPTRNSDVLRWCLNNGLRIVQPMTLMSLGLYNEPAGAFIPSILY
jgi:predicted N-acetyltransferase YhbS